MKLRSWKKVIPLAAVCLMTMGIGIWANQGAREARSNLELSSDRDFSQTVRGSTVGERPVTDRSFLYAPPPITHSVENENDSRACLKCHALEDNLSKRQMSISPVPHAEYSQCMQCHVKTHTGDVELFVESEFAGLDFPGKGVRAHDYAPPTIPHKTFMRENCLACHGPKGDRDLRTTHPERSQCQQCHVPEATQNYGRPVGAQSVRK